MKLNFHKDFVLKQNRNELQTPIWIIKIILLYKIMFFKIVSQVLLQGVISAWIDAWGAVGAMNWAFSCSKGGRSIYRLFMLVISLAYLH